jgi:hypothetical protein
MRRLLAYKETVTESTVSKAFGELLFAVDREVTFTEPTLLIRFTYNYLDYALVSKLSTDTYDSTVATSLGLAANTISIVVDADESDYIPLTIGYDVAKAIGGVKQSTVSSNTTLNVKVRADVSSAAKVFAITSTSVTYIKSSSATTVNVDVIEKAYSLADAITLDIDNETAIGFDFLSFDVRNPDRVGISHSNSFTLPRTPINENLHGFMGASDEAYNQWQVDYILDNEYIVKKGRIMVEAVENRIQCSIFSRDSAWDLMGQTLWADFMADYFTWVSSEITITFADYATMLSTLAAATTHIKLAGFYGDFFRESDRATSISTRENRLVYQFNGVDGGQFSTYTKSLFDFIASHFSIDFRGGDNSIFDAQNTYVQNRNIGFRILSDSTVTLEYVRGWVNAESGDVDLDKEGVTVLDFVKFFISATNSILDRIGENQYSLQPMDDIADAPIEDFSGLSGEPITFAPLIDGVGQETVIDFESYADTITTGSVSKVLTCENRNAESRTDYLKIPAHIPAAYTHFTFQMLGLFDSGTYKLFTLLEDSAITNTFTAYVRINSFSNILQSVEMSVASIYGIPYDGFQEIIRKPRVYRVKKWLGIQDVERLKFYQRYWIEELNGSFFLSEVKGFNPEGSRQATELEFILINRSLSYTITAVWGGFVCEQG